MSGYFIKNQASLFYQSDVFTKVLKYVQLNANTCKMKEKNDKLSLSFENVKSINDAINLLTPILKD